MCKHTEYDSMVNVTTFFDPKDKVTEIAKVASVRLKCAKCGVPFEFVHVPAGDIQTPPSTNENFDELYVQITPRINKSKPNITYVIKSSSNEKIN